MRNEPVIDPDVDREWALRLLELANAQVPGEIVRTQRVGPSEIREAVSWSLTALVVTTHHVVIAEVAVRGTQARPVVVQSFRRAAVLEVFHCENAAYALIDVPAVDSSPYGFRIEGPVVSLPAGTLANELL